MDFDIDSALDSLSSCIRCRKQRIRCDRLLPSCQKCVDAQVECETWDHILEDAVPRSYIYRLREKLQVLDEELAISEEHVPEGLQDPVDISGFNTTRSSSQASIRRVDEGSNHNSAWGVAVPSGQGRVIDASTGCFTEITDHVPPTSNGDSSHHEGAMYWGPSSAFAHLDLFLSKVDTHSMTRPPREELTPGFLDSPDFLDFLNQFKQTSNAMVPPPESVAVSLFEVFTIAIETFTPIVGTELFGQDLHMWYGVQHNASLSQHDDRRQSCLRAQLVLAIAVRILISHQRPDPSVSSDQRGRQTQILELSTTYFQAAASNLELAFDSGSFLSSPSQSATSLDKRQNVQSLRFLLLLVVYVLLDPRQGNVWELLGYAGRLREDILLSYRTGQTSALEGYDTSCTSTSRVAGLGALSNSLDCFEIQAGISFGRPIQISSPGEYSRFRTSDMSCDLSRLFHTVCILESQIHTQFMVSLARDEKSECLKFHKEWYEKIEFKADAWLQEWSSVCVHTGKVSNGPNSSNPVYSQRAGLPAWLIKVGRMLRDKVKHFALCLLLRRSAVYDLPVMTHVFTNRTSISGSEISKNYISSCWNMCSSSFHLDYSPGVSLDAYAGISNAIHANSSYTIELMYPILCVSPFDILRAAVSALWCAKMDCLETPQANQRDQPRSLPDDLISQIDQAIDIVNLMGSGQREIVENIKLALQSLKTEL